jgi:hypothetical protein
MDVGARFIAPSFDNHPQIDVYLINPLLNLVIITFSATGFAKSLFYPLRNIERKVNVGLQVERIVVNQLKHSRQGWE